MLRFNNSAFMTKKPEKEIMKRSKLKNNFNKNRNHKNWCKYKTQRNYCVNLLRKSKKQYFSNINVSDVTDNKCFLKFVKPYFSNKGSNSNKIALVENDANITNDRVISKTMNKFFINATKKLSLKPFKNSSDTDINQIISVSERFKSVSQTSKQMTLILDRYPLRNLIGNIKPKYKKVFHTRNNIKTLCRYLPSILNKRYKQKELKKAEIIPVYKKDDPLKKKNYRPVSLFPHVSKIFERLIYQQINGCMCDKSSKYITGFRKCHATQHSSLVMLEKWKKTLDKRENIFTIFIMDLSKAFDSINHDLLLAKLKAYGFSENRLKLMCSCLKDRRQAVQINNNFSSYKKVQAGVPQGSIDGPLLFNLFLKDF